jgi:hypothetical protein
MIQQLLKEEQDWKCRMRELSQTVEMQLRNVGGDRKCEKAVTHTKKKKKKSDVELKEEAHPIIFEDFSILHRFFCIQLCDLEEDDGRILCRD